MKKIIRFHLMLLLLLSYKYYSAQNRNSSTISSGFGVGLHYKYLMPFLPVDGFGFSTGHGTQLSVISPAILFPNNFRLSFLFDIGLSGHARSCTEQVVIYKDNTNSKGTYYLRQVNVHMNMESRLEYIKNNWGFYAVGSIGYRRLYLAPRLNINNSTTDYGSNMYANDMMQYGAGIGLTYYFCSFAGIDMRCSAYFANGTGKYGNISKVNYDKVNVRFSVEEWKRLSNPTFGEFRIGIILRPEKWFSNRQTNSGTSISTGRGDTGQEPVIVPETPPNPNRQ